MRVIVSVRRCAWVCTGVQVCTSVRWCVRLCLGVSKCAQVCMCVCGCVWDEFSEYLLETRFLTSANYDTHPLRIFNIYINFICASIAIGNIKKVSKLKIILGMTSTSMLKKRTMEKSWNYKIILNKIIMGLIESLIFWVFRICQGII